MTVSGRRLLSTMLVALMALGFSGCARSKPVSAVHDEWQPLAPPATLSPQRGTEPRSVGLRGVLVSLETSTKPFLDPGEAPWVVGEKPGYRVLSLRMVARNSTEATITGLHQMSIPVVTNRSGQRSGFLRSGMLADGAIDFGLRHGLVAARPPSRYASLRPGGRITYTLTFQLDSREQHVVIWELALNRIARFDLP